MSNSDMSSNKSAELRTLQEFVNLLNSRLNKAISDTQDTDTTSDDHGQVNTITETLNSVLFMVAQAQQDFETMLANADENSQDHADKINEGVEVFIIPTESVGKIRWVNKHMHRAGVDVYTDIADSPIRQTYRFDELILLAER